MSKCSKPHPSGGPPVRPEPSEAFAGGMTIIPEDKTSEAAAALAVLGYSTQEVSVALKGIDVENLKLEDVIRQALKKMVK